MATGRDVRAGRAYVELGVDDRIAAGLKRAAARFKAMGATITKTGLGLTAIGTSMLAPLALATRQFAQMGDEVNKASQRTGIAVSTLSELKYAADQSGSSLEEFEAATRKMSRTITDAADGSKEATESLAALGLSVQDLQGLSPDEQFLKIGDALSKVQDATKKAALAQELFGKSGARMLPMLADGADGIRELQQRARELGLTIGGEDAEAATRFGDILDDLWKQAKMVTFHIGAAIATALQPFAERATRILRAVIDWTSANRGLVVTIAAAAAGIVAAGGTLVGLGVSIQIAGYALAGLATLITATGAVLGSLLSPIGLVVAGLGVLTTWFLTSTDTGGRALAWLGEKFNELRGIATTAFGGIRDALAGGDLLLAAQILWKGLQVAWAVGTEGLRKKWADFKAGFVQTAAAAFYGALDIWTSVIAMIKSAWVSTVAFLTKLYNDSVSATTTFFEESERKKMKVRIDAQVANGKLAKEEGEKQKGFIDQQFNKQQDLRGVDEAAQQARINAERDASLSQIEADKQRTIDAYRKAEMELSAAAAANADAEKRRLEQELAALKQELARLNQEASRSGAGPIMPDARPVPDEIEDGLAGMRKSMTATATFNAAGAFGIAGGGTLEELKGIREGINKLVRKQPEAVV